uniref:Uncharacterized protein LOC107407915 n=1 Tax=Rhizophora mucronata TaxID=61149 RepID=A0A2P2LJ24_RHIMU
MRRSSSQLEKKRKRAKVIEKGIIWHQKATKCTELIEPTMLGNAYLDGIYWAISFASSLPKHCPWFTTTHNWLVKSSIKTNPKFFIWNKVICSRIVEKLKLLSLLMISNAISVMKQPKRERRIQ